MKPGFEPGITREHIVQVTEAMCPAFDGVVVHRCYSTWSAAHHMEIAARKVLVDFLDDDEEGVGAHISVDHIATCRVGKTVRVRAVLTEFDGRRVVCKVEAFEGDRLLAAGKQVQVVMDKRKIKEMIERS
ncbi:MAG: hypothetical protein IH987_19315 [Planctomycetes bacterium]|nr:hypothetical protein [Planctomycetota bacterium]